MTSGQMDSDMVELSNGSELTCVSQRCVEDIGGRRMLIGSVVSYNPFR